MVGPFATAVGKSKYIQALTEGFMYSMPLTLGVALIAVLANLPIEPWTQFLKNTGMYPRYFEGHAVFSMNYIKALENVAHKYNLFFENPMDSHWSELNKIHGLGFIKLDENGLYDPKKYLEEQLSAIKENYCSIAVFHPGFIDQYLLEHSSYTLIRTMECEFLCSQWLKDWLENNQIQLVNFDNYKR